MANFHIKMNLRVYEKRGKLFIYLPVVCIRMHLHLYVCTQG
jgi:hypothetical protein